MITIATNNAFNTDSQKARFAHLVLAGSREREAAHSPLRKGDDSMETQA